MAEFYSWPQAGCSMVTFCIALGVLAQTLAVVMSFYRQRRSRKHILEGVFELSILAQILVCSLLFGQVMQSYPVLLIAPTGYGVSRLIAFAALVLMAAAVIFGTRRLWPLLIIAVAGTTLPMLEPLMGNAFAYLYLLSMLFFLGRSVYVGLSRFREIKTSISALSVKNAIDSLNTGIMFCEDDGFILLCNTRMNRLMSALTGKIQRNGRRFYELFTQGKINPDCETTWLEGQSVCLLPDGSAWMFTITELNIKKRKYMQLTATDISERWRLTAELQSQNEQLKQRGNELNETIANLHILSHERETQRAKMRAHDILAERLTVMLRAARSASAPDYATLRLLSRGLLDKLKDVQSAPSPQEELAILKQTFEPIGVEVHIDGQLPEDGAKARLVTDIAREAVTNAVRHALATNVFIHMDRFGGGLHLRITDNGIPPSGSEIKEGGGLGGMREKLKPLGGALYVAVQPRFMLSVDLPGGDEDV